MVIFFINFFKFLCKNTMKPIRLDICEDRDENHSLERHFKSAWCVATLFQSLEQKKINVTWYFLKNSSSSDCFAWSKVLLSIFFLANLLSLYSPNLYLWRINSSSIWEHGWTQYFIYFVGNSTYILLNLSTDADGISNLVKISNKIRSWSLFDLNRSSNMITDEYNPDAAKKFVHKNCNAWG